MRFVKIKPMWILPAEKENKKTKNEGKAEP